MLNCFTTSAKISTPIIPIVTDNFSAWLEEQDQLTKNWLTAVNFKAKPETFCLLPDNNGRIAKVLFAVKSLQDFWSFGLLATALPVGIYQLENISDQKLLNQIAIAWGLGAYQFERYKKAGKTIAQLVLTENVVLEIENVVTAVYLTRDLINTPTENMGPEELAQAAVKLAQQFNAEIKQIIGEDLLKNNYPMIHAVGRASTRAPRLIDFHWGNSADPKITLIGKGVCFDTGGLDLKNSSGMLLMKKDMGGAAQVLGLAKMIMSAKLPVRLRVLIPAVENSVAGNAYRPGDVIATRKGLTVEVGNTDAEGRLVLCEALTAAVEENPELILDFATLTGAARVAVGTEISALFTDDNALAEALIQEGEGEQDPICRLPLYAPYRKMLDSPIADINNCGFSSYAGAITAALFLKEFVPAEISWAHFDLMAWNTSSRPGHPEGGEAMAIRAVFSYLQQRCSN